MREQAVVEYIQGELDRLGIFYINILGGFKATDSGEPDIVASVDGKFVAIECKANTKVSTAQFRRALEILDSGGRFVIAKPDIIVDDLLAGTLKTSPVNTNSDAEAMQTPKTTVELVSDDSIEPLIVDSASLSYGQTVAKAKYDQKKLSVRDKTESVALQDRTQMKANPIFYPDTTSDAFFIDWNDDFTDKVSDTSLNMIQNNRFAMLTAKTGVGKTAVVVATAGKMAIKVKQDLNIAIISTSKSIERNGWIKTVNAWNITHKYKLNVVWHVSQRGFTLTMKEKANIDFLKKELGRKGLLIVDEAHEFKNPTAKGSRSLAKLKSLNMFLLTASDITNDKLRDIASYLIIAGYYNSFNDFMKKEELKDLRNKNDDFLVYTDGEIDSNKWHNWLQVEQKWRKIHVKYAQTNLDMLPNVSTKDIYLDKQVELNQDIDSILKALRLRSFDSPKQAYQSILERIYTDELRLQQVLDIVHQDEVKQPLIFYIHNNVKEAIKEKLACNGIEWQEISGEAKTADFIDDKFCPVLVQYKSGGASIEFMNSNTSIFAENQPSLAKHSQAEGRNVRRGMTDAITHYVMHTDTPFDIKIIAQRKLLQEIADDDFERNLIKELAK